MATQKDLRGMWEELKARGWEIVQSVNRDGDEFTSLYDDKKNSVDTVFYNWVDYRSFREAIRKAWKSLH